MAREATAARRVVVVAFPVRLSSREHGQNAHHGHWSGRAKAAGELRETAGLATLGQWPREQRAAVAGWGPLALTIEYYRGRGQPMFDLDGLVGCCKSAIDGVFDALPGVDDRAVVSITARQPGRDPEGIGALCLILRPAVLAGEETD